MAWRAPRSLQNESRRWRVGGVEVPSRIRVPARRYCNHAKGTKQGAKGKRPSNARGTRKILKQIKLLKATTINLSPTPIKRRANASQHDVQRVVQRPRHAEVEAVRAARGRPGVRVDAQAEHRRDVDDPVARGEEGRGRGAVGHVDDLVAVLVLAGRRRGQLRNLREGRRGAAALGPSPPAFVGMMIAAMASWGISLVVDPKCKRRTRATNSVVATDPAASRSTFRASLSNAFSSTALNFSAGARACFALSPRFACVICGGSRRWRLGGPEKEAEKRTS